MRTSSSLSRLLGAGLTASAVTAAILMAPSSAMAAPVTSLSPAVGPAGIRVTAVVPNLTALTNATSVGVVMRTEATCPGTYNTTPAASNVAVAATNPAKGAVGGSTTPVSFTVPTLTLGASGAPRAYTVCIYAGTVVNTSVIVHDVGSNPQFTVTPAATTTPLTGASGAGGTITVTVPGTVTLPASLDAIFTAGGTGACPATYSGGSNITQAAVTRTSNTVASMAIPLGVLGTGTTATPYTVCLYDQSSTNLVAVSSTTYSVTLPTSTLSSVIGSSAGGQGITFTSVSNFLLNVASPGVAFVTTARCPTTYPAGGAVTVNGEAGTAVQAAGGAVRRLANNRLAVTVPALPLTNSEPTAYMACVYNGTQAGTSAILTAAAYTSTTVPAPTGISPTAGPAQGGNTVTVTGTDFPTTAGSITATLGGAALTNITPISATTFTATAPSHSPDNNVALTVTTSAGSRTLQNAYSFQNALDVDPNTAPNTTRLIDVTVNGTGFLAPTFGGSGNARIFLVDGEYNGVNNNSGVRINGPVAECTSVLVISDNQLVCSLQLNRRLTAAASPALYDAAAYNHTPATTIETAIGSRYITAATGSFNMNDVGQPISHANIPANSTITAVISPTLALISAAATVNTSGTPVTPTFGGAIRTTGTLTALSGATALTGAAGAFTSADIGRTIGTLSGVPAGTTITGISATGDRATLSAATTGAVNGAAPLHAPSAVPNGAYTLTFVSNGDVGASVTDDNYNQSVVSSSSTFTVAPF
ncbi:MAG TPA: IPT/TIG domain-containing protein [Actinoplanes sp.]|nr:IPT/TIG domain-containing protein [Actinoplanes sp.]